MDESGATNDRTFVTLSSGITSQLYSNRCTGFLLLPVGVVLIGIYPGIAIPVGLSTSFSL